MKVQFNKSKKVPFSPRKGDKGLTIDGVIFLNFLNYTK